MHSANKTKYSGFVRHKEPHLDAAGALADLLLFTLNLTGLDILQKIESQDTIDSAKFARWLVRHLWGYIYVYIWRGECTRSSVCTLHVHLACSSMIIY